ncbi:MAG: lysine--tRNA ligase [Candidatus Zixiibacteriota bacterium]|nr:MAG: lysine--tRNA ligase [candidate division Zixibacteria bacterium]
MPLAELMKIRRDKVREFSDKNVLSYPYRYERTHLIDRALADFDRLAEKETAIRLAGRIMLKRKMGKSFFAHMRDSSGQIQIYLKFDVVGQDQFDLFNTLDLGDIIGCEGSLFVTKTGERTLRVSSFELLTKALHPLPDKHSGLTDKEQRYRRRYADLIVNPEVRETFIQRSQIIKAIRDFLDSEGFLEVETPILQPIYGGGNARPFQTHYMRLDRDMYLRIADELYLKRLIIGGYDKVWEYCKDFRNEGMDRLHNPEFSMIEMYWAYADYRDMAALFEKMLREVVHKIHGTYKIPYGDHEIDFEPPFKWITMLGSIKEQTGIDFSEMSYEDARKAAADIDVEGEELINWGKVVEAVWEVRVEPTLIQPTFIADFPVEISPLAKKHRDNPRLTERFELFVAGLETGNAFSELNDPVDQLQRFMQQGKALAEGDKEAQPLDDDFVTALTYGMPPTAGLGFGIDRLVMILTNQHSIRDVIFFPQMKELGDGSVPVSQILSKIVDDEEKS